MSKQDRYAELETRLAALEQRMETFGPLAHAIEVEKLRDRSVTGGATAPITWEELDVKPGQVLLIVYSKGGELDYQRCTADGVYLRLMSGQNKIARAYVLP